MMVGRLSEFPWVIARVDCPLCPHRRGQYRLARLVEKFGADIQLCELLGKIAFDCPRKGLPWERPPNQFDPNCKARFTDLETTNHPPPDLPPRMRKLTIIQGGRGRAPKAQFAGLPNIFHSRKRSAPRRSVRQNALKRIADSAVTLTCFRLQTTRVCHDNPASCLAD
jgi:hypothetical protein